MRHATITETVPMSRPATQARAAVFAMPDPAADRSGTIFEALGLSGDPFPARPARGAWVAIPSRETVLGELAAWISDPGRGPARIHGGLAVVTGDAGSGRTSLFETLAGTLAERPDLLVATVPDDGNRRPDALLLRAMIEALGGAPVGRTGRELIAEIRALLTAHLDAGRRPVILVDNAAFSGSQLEIVRMLLVPLNDEGNVPGARPGALLDPLLVLFGPPELDDRIRRRRALAGMVTMRQSLAPLREAEIAALVDARIDAMRPGAPLDPLLEATGGGETASLFTPEAIAIVSGWSGGNLAAVIRIAGACVREAIAHRQAGIDRTIAQLVARELTDNARPATPVAEAMGSGESGASVIQTKLDLGFGDEEPEIAAGNHPIRNRRRRS